MLLLLCLAVAFQLQLALLHAINPLIITTIAGGGTEISDGTSAITANLKGPISVALDASGNIYIAESEQHRIRKVDALSKVITTVAGTGAAGFTGDGMIATKSKLFNPSGVTLDVLGNIYISDCGNDRIRRVDVVTNIMTTVAGMIGGRNTDGINATLAELSCPSSLVFDASGNMFFLDINRCKVKRVDAMTQKITTVVGTGKIGNYGNGVAATTAQLNYPSGLSLDASGNMYISDTVNQLIRRVDAKTKIITTIAGTGVEGFNGDNIRATKAQLHFPSGITVDAKGNIFIADRFNYIVRRIDPVTLNITTHAGTAGSRGYDDNVMATSAKMIGPTGVTVDAGGNMLIADYDANRVRYIFDRSFAPTEAPTLRPTKAPTTLKPSYGASIPNPLIITNLAGGGISNNDDVPAVTANLKGPSYVALDASGNIYIADSEHHRIRKVDALSKVITTVAGTGAAGYSGDNKVATKSLLSSPSGVTLDVLGNIYISDCGNDRIRRVDVVTNIMTTVAGMIGGRNTDGINATLAQLSCPSSLVFDASGNMFFADVFHHKIKRIDAMTQKITTVVGTGKIGNYGNGVAATTAQLNTSAGLSLDASGNMYISDTFNHLIRRVDAKTKIITTIAGTGVEGFNGDNIRATKAQLNFPSGITVDAKGNIFIADRSNAIVRRIDPVTLNITTHAGTAGSRGYIDNVMATSAKMIGPAGVTVDAGGNMLIADYDANRVRYIFDRSFAPTEAPTPAPSGLTSAPFSVAVGAPSTTQPTGKRIASTSDSLVVEQTGSRVNANFHRNIAIGVVVGALGAVGIASGFMFWKTRNERVKFFIVSLIAFKL
jgi:sugar lactone lactonase YvrE